MRKAAFLATVLSSLLAFAGNAAAICSNPDEAFLHGDSVIDKPRYNEANDTWYALISVCTYGYNRVTWQEASDLAYTLTHEGRRGRLAIVNDLKIHEFLSKFKPQTITWIGLRYWCRYHRMKWVDGKTHKLSGFNAWSSPWNAGAISRWGENGVPPRPQDCLPNSHYWPVHYWGMSQGFQWNANGTDKHGGLFFIEYPPAKKTDKKVSALTGTLREVAGSGSGAAAQ